MKTNTKELLQAVKDGNIDEIKKILNSMHMEEAKELVNHKYEAGEAMQKHLLLIAAKLCNTEVMKVLLRYGANIEEVTECGCTALLMSVKNQSNPDGALNVIKFLLNEGANIEHVNAKGKNVFDLSKEFHPEDPEKYTKIFEQAKAINELEQFYEGAEISELKIQEITEITFSGQGVED